MSILGSVQKRVLNEFEDGEPRSSRRVCDQTGLESVAAGDALRRLWRRGHLLRTSEPIREVKREFKGRAGIRTNLRSYYLYMLRPLGEEKVWREGYQFVHYAEKYLDERGKKHESKARLVLEFLRDHGDKAWYSKEVVKALKDNGVKPSDVMSNIRRYEKKRLVYVRGYRTDRGETPFQDGYILTWIDQDKPREQALEEAILRTEMALKDKASTSPVIHRVHLIKDVVFESTKLRDLASFEYIKSKLGCSDYQAETAISRALQLYPELKEIKLFDAFRYYYYISMPEDELRASLNLKTNYIRKVKGRANRVGHNWEAVVEYFIDTLTTGAKFWTQKHRSESMDPRRITIHLIKPVGGRRHNAEVDRVWEVTPGPLLQSTTYVLECKWGLVRKRDVDDFFDVLRWSKEFGVDTPDGRAIRQGTVGVFAGSAFDPREAVQLRDESKITLSTYSARMNIQLLKASDFNIKLQERGCSRKVSVQKICKVAKNEEEVREILEVVWKNPERSGNALAKAIDKNRRIYEFERTLEEGPYNLSSHTLSA